MQEIYKICFMSVKIKEIGGTIKIEVSHQFSMTGNYLSSLIKQENET